jgi:hypothetical protein
MSVWRSLKMHATQNIFGGSGEELLFHVDGNAVCSELSLVKGLNKVTASILENEGTEDFHSGQWFVNEVHGV